MMQDKKYLASLTDDDDDDDDNDNDDDDDDLVFYVYFLSHTEILKG